MNTVLMPYKPSNRIIVFSVFKGVSSLVYKLKENCSLAAYIENHREVVQNND